MTAPTAVELDPIAPFDGFTEESQALLTGGENDNAVMVRLNGFSQQLTDLLARLGNVGEAGQATPLARVSRLTDRLGGYLTVMQDTTNELAFNRALTRYDTESVLIDRRLADVFEQADRLIARSYEVIAVGQGDKLRVLGVTSFLHEMNQRLGTLSELFETHISRLESIKQRLASVPGDTLARTAIINSNQSFLNDKKGELASKASDAIQVYWTRINYYQPENEFISELNVSYHLLDEYRVYAIVGYDALEDWAGSMNFYSAAMAAAAATATQQARTDFGSALTSYQFNQQNFTVDIAAYVSLNEWAGTTVAAVLSALSNSGFEDDFLRRRGLQVFGNDFEGMLNQVQTFLDQHVTSLEDTIVDINSNGWTSEYMTVSGIALVLDGNQNSVDAAISSWQSLLP